MNVTIGSYYMRFNQDIRGWYGYYAGPIPAVIPEPSPHDKQEFYLCQGARKPGEEWCCAWVGNPVCPLCGRAGIPAKASEGPMCEIHI